MSDFDNFDDLDAVRDFRSLAQPFPPEVDAAIRRRIHERAASRDLPDTAPTPARAAGRADADRAAGPEPVEVGGSLTAVAPLRVPDRPRRSVVRLVAAGFVLAAVLAAGTIARRSAGTVDVGPGDGTGDSVPATAPDTTGAPGMPLTVEGLISRAATQPDRTLEPGWFQHLAVERQERTAVPGATEPAVQSTLMERWAAPDRPGRWLTRMTMSRRTGSGTATSRSSQVSEPRSLDPANAFDGVSYRELRELPRDRGPLEEAVGRRVALLQKTPALEAYLSYLAQPVVQPEVRAALWRLLADRGLRAAPSDPGSAAAPGPDDLVGAHAAGGADAAHFTLTDGAGVWTIAVDPATTALRSWERRDPGQDRAQVRQVVVAADLVPAPGPGVIGP